MFLKYAFLILNIIFFVSCGRLQFDTSKAFRLATVSVAPSPGKEDVRSFVQHNDLVYTAAGSGGILVYRVVGDAMNPVESLSLSNLYSEELEPIYIRTIEILQTPQATNLIYAYDTLRGGGIGVAEISPFYTRPLGSLKIIDGVRIKNTSTTYNPKGVFHIVAAQENAGLVSYDLTFISNNYFEIEQIASLVDFVAQTDLERPAQNFLSLDAPGALKITNIAQITNVESLVELALDNPEYFSSVISNLPFIPAQQREQIQQLLTITNQALISDLIDTAEGTLGKDIVNKVINNPQSLNSLLTNEAFASALPAVLESSGLTNIESLDEVQSNISPDLVAKAQTVVQNTNSQVINSTGDVQDILSLSGLQQVIQSALDIRGLDDEDDELNVITVDGTNVIQETQTLFEESVLSNVNLAEGIDTDLVHNTNFNPFANRKPVGNATTEIQRTVNALGRPFFVEENEDLKNRLLTLTDEELQSLFAVLFEQADTAISLIPLFESAGVNVRELYEYWMKGDYIAILESVDASIIAEILRRLPRYKIDTVLVAKETNVNFSRVERVSSDLNYFYVASGADGVKIIDRLTWKIHDSIVRPFSDITTILPYQWNNKNYYVIADRLDGITVYRQKRNKKIGEQVSRISLVGEVLDIFPYEDILWVADGSNGVLAVRINKDETLTIEAERYQKHGIAYYIGAGRRREVLASYGADGLRRFRITNVVETNTKQNIALAQVDGDSEAEEDFIDRVIIWSQNSEVAQFLKRLFF